MPTIIDGTTGVSKIQDGAITADDFAAGAVVTSVNGQTGAVTISAEPTTAQVLAATAGASVGAVGTYAFLGRGGPAGTVAAGATLAGSGLRFTHAGNGADRTPAATGTWRCMGRLFETTATNAFSQATVFLRIS